MLYLVRNEPGCPHLNHVHSVLGEEAEVLHVSAPHVLWYSGSGNTLAMA